MDTGALVFLGVVFLVAFGLGGFLARRLIPPVDGEKWTQRGKRNVIAMLAGWSVIAIAGAAVILLAE